MRADNANQLPPDNQHVFLSAAIRISFMEMAGKPQADIDQAIKQARRALRDA